MRGECVGFGEAGGDGLFHQNVKTSLQGFGCKGKVRLRRGGDDHRVAGLQQGGPGERRGAGLLCHGGGAGGVAVVQAGQRGARGGGHLQRMETPEMPGADNADPQARHVLSSAGRGVR